MDNFDKGSAEPVFKVHPKYNVLLNYGVHNTQHLRNELGESVDLPELLLGPAMDPIMDYDAYVTRRSTLGRFWASME